MSFLSSGFVKYENYVWTTTFKTSHLTDFFKVLINKQNCWFPLLEKYNPITTNCLKTIPSFYGYQNYLYHKFKLLTLLFCLLTKWESLDNFSKSEWFVGFRILLSLKLWLLAAGKNKKTLLLSSKCFFEFSWPVSWVTGWFFQSSTRCQDNL